MVKPSLKTDQYSKFEIDNFTLKFTNKSIEMRFKKKKKKSDSNFHKLFLFCLFVCLLLLEITYKEKEHFSFQYKMVCNFFAIFIFFCWIGSFFKIYQRFYSTINGYLVIIFYIWDKKQLKKLRSPI